MEKKWQIAIIVLFLALAWIRIGPAIPWTIQAQDFGDRMVAYNEWCNGYFIEYEWSWWSLRVTSVYPVCNK